MTSKNTLPWYKALFDSGNIKSASPSFRFDAINFKENPRYPIVVIFLKLTTKLNFVAARLFSEQHMNFPQYD